MRLATLVLLLAGLAACARAVGRGPEPTTTPERLQEFLSSRRDAGVPENPQIAPGDVIHVDVRDVAEASREYTVSRKGSIRLPFVGEAEVGEKTVEQAGDEIARRLDSVVVDPRVEVSLVDVAGGEVTIEGAIERPGKIRLGLKGKTLLEALALAGGLTPEATGAIRIVPGSSAPPGLFAETPEALMEEPIELAANDVLRGGESGPVRLYLRAGDRIEVTSQAGTVASAGPDPLAELGLPMAETESSSSLEVERPKKRNRPPADEPVAAVAVKEEPEPAPRPTTRAAAPSPPLEARTEASGEQELRREIGELRRRLEERESASRERDSTSQKLQQEIDSLKRRIEAGEVDLRAQVRRVEGESSVRQRELEAARAEAAAARQRSLAERQRAESLTTRIAELEASRGGPTAAVSRASAPLAETEGEFREIAPLPAPTPAGEGRRGGLFSALFGGGSAEEEEEAETEAAEPMPPAAPEPPPAQPAEPPRVERLPRIVEAPPRREASVPPPVVRAMPPQQPVPSRPASPPIAMARPVAPARPAERPAFAGVSISGRVQAPGVHALAAARTVTRAVTRAGLAPGADVSKIEVRRSAAGEGWRILVNLREVQAGRSPDLVLEDGDSIQVP